MLRQLSLIAGLVLAASPSRASDSDIPDLAGRAEVTASSSATGSATGLTAGAASSTLAVFETARARDWQPAPGTSATAWVALAWPEPLTVEEILVEQGGRSRLTHLDLEVQGADGKWMMARAIGDSATPLPHFVQIRVDRQMARAVKIGRFSGPVVLRRISVYDKVHPPRIETGSDLLGHFIGILTDAYGTRAFSAATVMIESSVRGRPWHATAQTDEHGMFQAQMPVGLDGTVAFRSELPGGETAAAQVPANEFTPGLTLQDKGSAPLDLNGTWKFSLSPDPSFLKEEFSDAEWRDIRVPAHYILEGAGEAPTGGYRRRFEIPREFRDRRLILHFDAVYSGSEVWVNGRLVGSHDGGFVPFEFDITDVARIGGSNLIAVLARENTPSSHLDQMSSYADFPLTGIFRKVYLFGVPAVHVQRMHVTPGLDGTYTDGELAVDLAVENDSERAIPDARIEFTMSDAAGNHVAVGTSAVSLELPALSRFERSLKLPIARPRHWEAEHPYLYTLTARLIVPQGPTEAVARRVGFRTVEVKGTQILINGVPVKLRGTGHIDFDPLRGRAEEPSRARRELELMKEANLDAFRATISPALPEMIDYADEMGFYVEEEASFNWVSEAYDRRYTPLVVQRTAEMLDRDRSNPSVIFWSLVNESAWGPIFDRANAFVERIDPTRLRGAAISATLTVSTHHNPMTTELIHRAAAEKTPVIWDEDFGPFQGIWGDAMELWRDPGQRDYWVAPQIPIWEELLRSPTVQGSMIWAWSDEIFLVPGRSSEVGRQAITKPRQPLDATQRMTGRGQVGDAPWGLVDIWQRKKPEFWHFKMLMAPLRITAVSAGSTAAAAPVQSDYGPRVVDGFQPGQAVRLTVENRYEFTDLSETTLKWSVGNEHGESHPRLAPRTTGEVAIPVGPSVKPGDWLDLQFVDNEKRLVMPYRLRLGEPSKQTETPATPITPLRYQADVMLAGTVHRIIGQGFEIAFDGASGMIRRALVDNRPVLYGSPKLHIQPRGTAWQDLPAFDDWRLVDPLEIERTGDEFVVTATGTYGSLGGTYKYRISPIGELGVTYHFTYSGQSIWVKEVGMQLGMPLWCDTLHWRRKGEWTVYPDDHIGRLEGTAHAHASGTQEVPPQQSYAADDSQLGTNDFRSTKRNFIDATVLDRDGYGVGIIGSGAQHLRTQVGLNEIEVNVNDWYGGTSAQMHEWLAIFGRGRMLLGDDPNGGQEDRSPDLYYNPLRGSLRLMLLGPGRGARWEWLTEGQEAHGTRRRAPRS